MISRRDAEDIAQKLEAEIREGKRHRLVIIKEAGQPSIQFGIGRGSREKDLRYIPRQLRIKDEEAHKLARCSMGKDEYHAILYGSGFWQEKNCL